MDADNITSMIDNDQYLYDRVNDRTIEILEENGFNGSNPDDSERSARDYYELIGDAILDLFNNETDFIKDKPTLLGYVFSTMINDVNWREVGEHFYKSNVASLTSR